jgi:hypothetical protein
MVGRASPLALEELFMAFEQLTGFIDIHVHSAPSIFARSVTDLELARQATELNMRGFVLKAHEESTVSRAMLMKDLYPNLDVFGCLVLNWYVGGLNPYAVNLALEQGAKIIWMPTGSSKQHLDYFGGPDYKAQPSNIRLLPQEGITILDDYGEVKPELVEILDLIAEKNVVAASGHLSPKETVIFVHLAKERGVQKILVAHPDLGINKMPLELQVELTRQGAYVEKSYLPLMPNWGLIQAEEVINSIMTIGIERCVLQTDFGQTTHVTPPLGYQAFLRLLLEKGVSEHDLQQMGAHNPADLLDLPRMPLDS